MANCNQLTSLL